MPELTVDELSVAFAVLAAVALILLVAVVLLFARLSAIKRNYILLRGDGELEDIFGAVGRAMHQMDSIDKKMVALSQTQERQAAIGKLAIQKFGMVRYDAFEDMGGRLSFSAALLDDNGDGFVLTSINGRTETRTYAKAIKQSKSQHNLSQEETAAIAAATGGQGRTASPPK